jgi:16S rRNA (cytosine1402-N4)-methyltransferase
VDRSFVARVPVAAMTEPESGPDDEAPRAADALGFAHEPVMLAEVLDVLLPAARSGIGGGVVVDATVGGGGHAAALLAAAPEARLVGLDRDRRALEASRRALAPWIDRVELRHVPFERIGEEVRSLGMTSVAGFLFDLGVSSHQLDTGERGFSFRHEGPLDMRMDDRDRLTAADVVNGYEMRRLASVLRTLGDERHADRIARAVVAARPILTTTELSEIVRAAIPAATRRTGGHPAKRTFQAIRIEVNRELAQLPDAIDAAIDLLAPSGRGVVLSYHSGEDRIVKDRFRYAETGGCTCPPRLPCGCGAVSTVRPLRRRSSTPGEAEVARNPRSASARLRAVEKLAVAA